VVLLLLVMLGSFVPPVTVGAVHSISVLVVAAYVAGLLLIRGTDEKPMWRGADPVDAGGRAGG
jgi:hypothetical protein